MLLLRTPTSSSRPSAFAPFVLSGCLTHKTLRCVICSLLDSVLAWGVLGVGWAWKCVLWFVIVNTTLRMTVLLCPLAAVAAGQLGLDRSATLFTRGSRIGQKIMSFLFIWKTNPSSYSLFPTAGRWQKCHYFHSLSLSCLRLWKPFS